MNGRWGMMFVIGSAFSLSANPCLMKYKEDMDEKNSW